MKKQQFPKYLIYAVLSAVSPIVALLATLTYQSVANSDFWSSLTDKEGTTNSAGAMMAFGEFIQLILFTIISCVVGIIFAIIGFRLWRRTKRKIVIE